MITYPVAAASLCLLKTPYTRKSPYTYIIIYYYCTRSVGLYGRSALKKSTHKRKILTYKLITITCLVAVASLCLQKTLHKRKVLTLRYIIMLLLYMFNILSRGYVAGVPVYP